MKPLTHIRKIAVFRALKLGDMLCSVPAMRALRAAYPNAEITLLGLPWAKTFVERFDIYFDRFIHFPGYKGLPEQPYVKEQLENFIDDIQAENFDLVLQMQGNGTFVNPLIFLFHAKYVAGFYNEKSYIDSDFFIEYPDHGYEAKRHLLLLKHLGIKPRRLHLEFPLTEKDAQHFKELLLPVVAKKYICIHPGSADANRRWSPQFFAALADFCIEKNFTVVITGTEEEREVTAALIKCIHHPVIDVTGKTDIGSVAVLIRNAFMLIANCTGVAHIAAAVKTPSLIISMDGEPKRWSPANKQLHCVIDWTKKPYFENVFTALRKRLPKEKSTA